ncbi:MAG: orotate phosphoribosyltransferase [Candidatus Nitrosocaldus sp.]|nr:orotate phosphoribosyltransferase [Candidatus Nitrosocaldus sp.]MCS7140943.1 orotate phosphoribosyltransferase [Candidatus Nitrosocaldus sp.]MDW7999980.1 orotate phosphoribosyltransferase [Candidatus Nitrosocaldus sp.]MDW8275378.1 orotate phosphoribosyltransferase [Candidatus Nitrosocaldus sp.]
MKGELAEFLLKSNAIRFGIFRLASGKESTYYIDLRVLPSFPAYFRMAVEALREKVEEEIGKDAIDYICTIPSAGLVYASALAYTMEKSLVYVRKDVKDHGTSRLLEGYLRHGSRVLLLDDVATTGTSLAYAADVVRSNGGIVEHAIVLIDRLEGAGEHLAGKGIRLTSVADIEEVVEMLYRADLLDEDTVRIIKAQMGGNR